MALFKTFTLDGENSATYGLYISGDGVYNAPERSMQLISIPGKNGALAIDNAKFENIEVRYPAGIVASTQEEFRDKVDAARNWLASKHFYAQLRDDYNPDTYRMALFKDGLEVGPAVYNHAGQFEIVFNCKPQRFLVEGSEAWDEVATYSALQDENSAYLTDEIGRRLLGGITLKGNTITNPTLYPARPLIVAQGPGTIGIGSQTITVFGIGTIDEIYIDCEIFEIYRLSGSVPVSSGQYVTFSNAAGEFPAIEPGAQGFTHSMPVRIIPRWWRL